MDAITFKVVRAEMGCFYSAMKQELPWEYVLQYRIGNTTTPKIGRIFVFKTYGEAYDFMINNLSTTNILRGKATNIGRPKYLADTFWKEKVVSKFWRNKILKKKQTVPLKTDIAQGSLTCSTFTPTELEY